MVKNLQHKKGIDEDDDNDDDEEEEDTCVRRLIVFITDDVQSFHFKLYEGRLYCSSCFLLVFLVDAVDAGEC